MLLRHSRRAALQANLHIEAVYVQTVVSLPDGTEPELLLVSDRVSARQRNSVLNESVHIAARNPKSLSRF